MTSDEVSYRQWARKNWRPGKPIRPEWNDWVQDEIAKIQQDRKVIVEREVIHRIMCWQSNQWAAMYYLHEELYPMLPGKEAYIRTHPRCNSTTYHFINDEFKKLDATYHPDVIAGGLWFKQGWTIDDDLQDWEVYIPDQEEGVPAPDGAVDTVPADCPESVAAGAADA